jgi:phytoene dehydrogenase-like protein
MNCQFITSGAYTMLSRELHECGLEYVNTDDVLCATVSDDGKVTMAYRSIRKTASQFSSPEDGRTYRSFLSRVSENIRSISGLMSTELRSFASAQTAMTLLRSNGILGSEEWLRDLATSGRAWCQREFEGTEVDRLWVPWLLHGGLSPDHASGGFMIPVFAAGLHGAGVPVVVGGAGRFVEAFQTLLDTLGVTTMTQATVDRIVIDEGRAVGVEVNGEMVAAGLAVLASVTPTALYGRLLPRGAVDERIMVEAERFRYGRAAMQVHVALKAPLSWRDGRLRPVGADTDRAPVGRRRQYWHRLRTS